MNAKQFGKLVASLRKEKIDPETGKRWTQDTLAIETGLSQRIIATIEQGTKAKLETDTLVDLADAFKLNYLARKEFFSFALAPEYSELSISQIQTKIHDLLDLMKHLQLPALLHDDYYDIVAVNSLSIAFNISTAESVGITEPVPITRDSNLLCMLFSPDSVHRQRLAPIWGSMSSTCVQLFHRYTLQHRSTHYFQTLFNQLVNYREFRQIWEVVNYGDGVEVGNYQSFQIKHPKYGTTQWQHGLTLSETPIGNLHLSIVLPANPAALEAIAAGIKVVRQGVYQLQKWPLAEKFPCLS